jgi:ribonuclease E
MDLASQSTAELGASSTPAPVIATSVGMPPVEAYVLPLDQLAGIAQQSGLTWVNSDAEKIAAVQTAIAAEPKLVHVPRERPPVVALDNRPLVLVETRLDLRDIKLPFEETQSV